MWRSGVWHSGVVESVVTIGVFDGVHRGHQSVIQHTLEQAQQRAARAIVLTFEPNPLEVLRPDHAPTRLCSLARRVELIKALGDVDVEVLRFDTALSQVSAQDFITDILQGQLQARAVVVGEGFRFGHKAAGTTQTLQEAGLDVVEYGLVGDDQPVSSTRVRAAVAEGDVGTAATMLGRPHEVEGVVVAGEKRGRDLGYPTANVEHHQLAAVPADGIYAGTTVIAGEQHAAAISVGTNPTFEAEHRTLESYLLDFDGDLYGASVRVTFSKRLRGMVAFDGVDALVAQMAQDVAATRRMMDAM